MGASIKGVEILRVGTWKGYRGEIEVAQEDLEEYVAAYDAATAAGMKAVKVSVGSKVENVPLNRTTLGHNELDRRGLTIREAPMIGVLGNLRVKGEALLADILDVPERLAKVIEKAYPDRSFEGITVKSGSGIQIGKRTFKRMVTGLALLGESLPAVTTLADLPKVLAAEVEGEWILFAEPIPDPVSEEDYVTEDLPTSPLERGYEFINQAIRKAAQAMWKIKPDAMDGPYVTDIFDAEAIMCYQNALWSVPYTVDELGEATLGTPVKVRAEYVPVQAARQSDTGRELEDILDQLDRMAARVEVLTKGRKGNPIIRARFRALKERIAGTVRLTTKEKTMDVAEIRSLLKLDENASTPMVVRALVEAAKVAPQEGEAHLLAAVVDLAEGMVFDNVEQFVAWLAGKLDVSPGDLAAIASAVAEAMGFDSTPTDAPAPDAAPPPAGDMPAASEPQGEGKMDVTALQAALGEQSAKVTELLTWRATQEGQQAKLQAAAEVDRHIAAGKFLPAQRETLVTLANHDLQAFSQLASGQPVVKRLGQRGSSAEQPISVAETDVQAMVSMGYSREDALKALELVAKEDGRLEEED